MQQRWAPLAACMCAVSVARSLVVSCRCLTSLILARQNGTSANDDIHACVALADGSVVLAGSTQGDWAGDNASGAANFLAIKLDKHGSEVWSWQVREKALVFVWRRYNIILLTGILIQQLSTTGSVGCAFGEHCCSLFCGVPRCQAFDLFEVWYMGSSM